MLKVFANFLVESYEVETSHGHRERESKNTLDTRAEAGLNPRKLSQGALQEVVAKSRTLNNTNRRRILQVKYKLALLTELIKNLEALKLIQSK